MNKIKSWGRSLGKWSASVLKKLMSPPKQFDLGKWLASKGNIRVIEKLKSFHLGAWVDHKLGLDTMQKRVTEFEFGKKVDELLGLPSTDGLSDKVSKWLGLVLAAMPLVSKLLSKVFDANFKMPDISIPIPKAHVATNGSTLLNIQGLPSIMIPQGQLPVMSRGLVTNFTYRVEGYASPIVQPSGSHDVCITSTFGFRGDIGVSGASSDHGGVDIQGVEGRTAVCATEAGTVVYAGSAGAYGANAVYLAYPRPDGTTIMVEYGHMKSKSVRTGDKVQPGQVVGYVGKEGLDCAPHLHMSVSILPKGVSASSRPRKYRINPMRYLRSLSGAAGFDLKYTGSYASYDAMTEEYNRGQGKRAAEASLVLPEVGSSQLITPSQHVPVITARSAAPAASVSGVASSSQILPGEVVTIGGIKRYKLKGITYRYYTGKTARDMNYNNPMNVKGLGYEGQTGDDRDAMLALVSKNARYANSGSWHAAFSDPYYSIKAAMFDTKICVNWPASCFTLKALKGYNPADYGFPEPLEGRNLYMMCCRYGPIAYNPSGPAQGYNSWPGHCGPMARAQKIVARDPGAWPDGINTVYDFSKSKGQFKCFVRATLEGEQGVLVEDWYLDACWEAIYNGGPEPTQANLKSTPVVLTGENMSHSYAYTGYNTAAPFSMNRQE